MIYIEVYDKCIISINEVEDLIKETTSKLKEIM